MKNYKPLTCIYCGKYEHSFDTLSRHTKRHREKYLYLKAVDKKCKGLLQGSKCLQKNNTSSSSDSSALRKTLHSVGKSNLSHDNSVSNSVTDNHVLLHVLINGSYQCKCCLKCFNQRNDFTKHILAYAIEKPDKFDNHQACLTVNENLSEHLRRPHTYPRRFQCKQCLKRFIYRKDLTRHIRTHTKERPYQCEYCQKRFSDNGNLTTHIRTHTKERPYQCMYCQKCFTQNGNLKEHIRIHTKDKPFQCGYCQKRFADDGNLRRHTMTHTKEKPYQCEYCQKCFTQKGNLIRHIRIHTKEKPFQCKYCQKRFADNGNLAKHMRIHTKETSEAPSQLNQQMLAGPPIMFYPVGTGYYYFKQ